MFKVVPDQLRVSDGWVRCGQCSEVFDGNATLQPDVAVGQQSTPPVMEEQLAKTPTVAAPIESDQEVPAEWANVLQRPVGIASADLSAPFLEVNPHALHIEREDVARRVTEPVLPRKDLRDLLHSPLEPVPREEQIPTPIAQHSFIRAADIPSMWDRRWARVLQALFCFTLATALALQIVVFERDRIAATLPETLPVLEPLCAAIGCTISPFRHIESVVIDSSSFTKVRGDVYKLSFTLKNTAPTRLATPAMELTLTNMQDQTVVRRVFVASDYAGASAALDVGAEMHASLSINVKLPASEEKISGYRLLSFYP